jgi:hypothetical protein
MHERLTAIFTGLLLILLPFLSSAQIYRRDIIHLKNGMIVRGIILEMVPNGNIKVEAHHRISMFKMEQVEWIEKENVRLARHYVDSLKLNAPKPSGYFVIANFGLMESPGDSDLPNVSEGLVSGFHVTSFMSLGLGAEISSYSLSSNSNSTVTAYPVFADIRFYIPTGTRFSPMFVFNPGYSFINGKKFGYYGAASSQDFIPTGGGLYVSSGTGFRFTYNKRFSILADIGVGFQKFSGHSYDVIYNSSTGIYQYRNTPQTIHTTTFLRGGIGLCISFGK